MGYRVKVTTGHGVRWLCRGRLLSQERLAMYYSSPSAARVSARGYINAQESDYTFEIVDAKTLATVERVTPWGKRTKFLLNIERQKDGTYRVWNKGLAIEVGTNSLCETLCQLGMEFGLSMEAGK